MGIENVGIVVICGLFEKEDSLGYPTGEKEFGVSHGIDNYDFLYKTINRII